MKRQFLFIIACCALLALTATFAVGQEAGLIAGTVRDASGAVIANATVTATNQATSATRTAQSNSVGQFTIPGLEPGKYAVKISSPSFTTYEKVIEVTVGGRAVLDAQLTVGASTTVVEVAAGGVTEVNTQTQEISQLIDSQQISQLPSLTRNPYDFVAIAGNVSNGDSTTPNSMGSQNLTGRGVGFSINGQRMSGTEILLDGEENVDLFGAGIGQAIPIDSVQEYRIITNNFDAQYGRASGGVVNLTTKSGTNAFHGSLWEFNRTAWGTSNTYANDAANAACLTAATCTNATLPDPKGQYTRNQFGYEFGGPLIKNKLFAYLSTEWTRVRSQPIETQEVLDPAFIAMMPANIQSYFAAYGSGAPAPTRTVDAATLLTAGIPMGPVNGVTAIPGTTPVFDVVNFHANFDAGGGDPQNTYTLVGRLDYNLSDKTQMFFRFARDNEFDFLGTASYSAYSQYNVGGNTYNDSGVYSISHSFSSNLFLNAKFGVSRFDVYNNFNTALTSTPSLMIAGFATDPTTGLPIQLPGLENVAPGLGGLPFGGPQNTFQPEVDLSWIKGKHSMRFGFEGTYIQMDKGYGAYFQAVEELGAGVGQGMGSLENITGNPGGSPLIAYDTRVSPDNKLPCHTDAFGNIIATPACEVTPPLGPAAYSRSYRYKDFGLYAQDSFRATPRLTLNYGIRLEHFGVQHNLNPALDSNFYFGPGANLYQRVRSGQVDIADQSPVGQFWTPDWGTWAPRLGFAYDVFGDGKTSLRGGFGISYERNFGNVTFNASFNPPASAVLSSVCAPNASGTVGGPATPCAVLATNSDVGPLGSPGPPLPLPPAELRMPDPNIHTAQTQFWSLDLQRQVARNTVIDIGYNGAHGVHLYDIENINLVGSGNFYLGDDTIGGAACAFEGPGGVCLTRANNQFSNINMRGSLGTSSYNSLNVKFQTNDLRGTGLGMVANYTWSHSLDDLSSTFSDNLQGGSGAIGNLGYTTAVDPKLDWGNSDYDVRNRFVVSPVWQTPWLKSQNGLLGHALGGWTVSGVFTVRSGLPFSIFDYSNDFNFYTVPRLTPDTPITNYHVGSGTIAAPNLFNVLQVPVPAPIGPLDPALGISDFGPYPADMTRRNAFRGPGAWNTDAAISKSFKVTERVGLEFRAEGFDLFNHHDLFVNTSNLAYGLLPPPVPLQGPGALMLTGSNFVTAEKGGLGSTALGGNHDQRRFGQFALRLNF